MEVSCLAAIRAVILPVMLTAILTAILPVIIDVLLSSGIAHPTRFDMASFHAAFGSAVRGRLETHFRTRSQSDCDFDGSSRVISQSGDSTG